VVTGGDDGAPPLLELCDVRKTHAAAGAAAPVEVLHGVSLAIREGEFVAIVGASGSGKSTLMNILGCLDRPSSGAYRLAGVDVTADAAGADLLARMRCDCFGFVFQHYHLIPGRSALENVMLPGVYAGVPRAARAERARSLLERMGLGERLHHRPAALSGGEQQRVAIARALMNGGRVILADEPTGALDTKTGAEVMAALAQLWAEGHTVIVVTHDPNVARAAPRVIELSDGRVVADRVSAAPARTAALAAPPSRTRSARLRDLWEGVAAAGGALRASPLRTLLTLLGIMVGVAAVVALLAVGEGAKRSVLAQLSAFGTNRMYVFPSGGDARGARGALTIADVEIVRDVPNVAAAMPYLEGAVTARFANRDHRTTGVAITTDFPRILNWGVERGAFFAPDDERQLAAVAVVGRKLARALFEPEVDPLGQYVLVDEVPFQVVGILSEKGALAGDADADDTIVFPYTTGSQRIFGTPDLSWISVLVDDLRRAAETEQAIERELTAQHRVKDFDVYNKAATIAAQQKTLGVMTSLLALTAAISLLVGGIGVMNIMLMTVTERTREIGIRVAVGASPRDVARQFLIEALALSVAGGAIGLVLGFALGAAARAAGMEVAFSPDAALLSFACAGLTGIVSGYAPARRAARLDPVLSLARE
jgi:macrolide transport system ATP-binding/permease protein